MVQCYINGVMTKMGLLQASINITKASPVRGIEKKISLSRPNEWAYGFLTIHTHTFQKI